MTYNWNGGSLFMSLCNSQDHNRHESQQRKYDAHISDCSLCSRQLHPCDHLLPGTAVEVTPLSICITNQVYLNLSTRQNLLQETKTSISSPSNYVQSPSNRTRRPKLVFHIDCNKKAKNHWSSSTISRGSTRLTILFLLY